VLAALACSRMSAVSLTDVRPLRRRGRALVPAVGRPTGRTTLPAWRCQLFSQVGSGGDYGCGRCAPTGKINEDGRSSRRFSQKASRPGGLSPCLGPSGWRSGAWRVPRAGARSGHRTCCWARPGSRAGAWWPYLALPCLGVPSNSSGQSVCPLPCARMASSGGGDQALKLPREISRLLVNSGSGEDPCRIER
jgi:hypothetical protein